MFKTQHILFCIIGIFGIVTSCVAKDWRGIRPLHSTKKDVVRLLGSSVNTNEVRSIYQLENEEVYIVFSGSQFCSFEATKIPIGTVLLIQVTPRTELEFTDLQLDREKLREFNPSSQDSDWKGFVDEQEGIVVRSFKDKIDKIFYIAAARDRALCPNYYAEPEKFARIVVDFTSGLFDEYSQLAFVNEKARLDNFAIYLQKDKPTWKAYIVAYPSADAVLDARARIDRAKQYLISIGLSEERILTMIGGRRDKLTIELYALPPDQPPPTPNPTTNQHPFLKTSGEHYTLALYPGF